MKSLLIVRHAEAAAASAILSDVDRPLTELGQEQARQLGSRLREQGIRPDRIACSGAARASQTAAAAATAAEWAATVTVNDDLYNASAAEILALVACQPQAVTQFCIVAHAPGVAELVSLLTTKHADLALMFAAATLAKVELDIDYWSEIRPNTGALQCLLAP